MADLIGQRLGNYRLLRLIGRGGFADVYLAEHIHLGTQAAIKVLQVRLVESNRENFLNEARTIAHLVHPYIIRVLDFGVENEIPFLVMDYAPRGTFRQRYLQGKPLPAAPLVSFMKQTAAALQYGHDKKLIHRDVKPENMLLGPNDEVLLSDFGFALIAHNSTSSMPTETAGTAAYMAPEQLQGKPRPASDQYALGIIAYEWLSGSCPFQGSFFEIASQQVFMAPPPLREKVSTIAPEIVKVVMTALEKDPQFRFPTVRDFALALEEACLISKQYAFNLPITQQPSSTSSSVSGVTFSTGDRRSRDDLILSGDNRYLLDSAARDVHKLFSLDQPSQPVQSGVPQSGQEESSAAARTGYTSLGHIRPFTISGITSEQELSFPTHRSASHIQLLPANSAPDPRQPSSFAPAYPSQPGPDLSSRPYRFSTEMQPQAKNLPQVKERYSPPPTLPQGNRLPESLPPGTLSTRAQIYAPTPQPVQAKVSSTQNTNKGPQTAQTNTPPLHLQSTRNNSSKPNTILLVSLFILLILGVSAGAYSYVTHSRNNSTAQHASSKNPQKKTQGQPTPLTSIKPITTAIPTAMAITDTTNPYPPHSGTFVMNETLANNNYGWQESTTPIGGACRFVEGGYQDYNPIIDPNPCFAYNTNFANFTYQIDMKFTSIGQLHSGGGIIFRGNSTTGKYYFFEIYNSGKYSLQVCNAGDCTLQLAGYKSDNQALKAFHPGLNVPNTLAVVAIGTKFDLYVNNQFIKEVVDPNNTYTTGMIGVLTTGGNDNNLRTAATSTPGQVLFSNAKMWKL